MKASDSIRDEPAFRAGLWSGLVMAPLIYAEQAGVVQIPSIWFVLALIAILAPSAPALSRLTPLWRNYFVPFTGPARSEYPLVVKRFIKWCLGVVVSMFPLAVLIAILFG